MFEGIYGHGGHFGHATFSIYMNFRSPFQTRLNIKLTSIGKAVSQEKMFEHCGRLTNDGDKRDYVGIICI